MAEKTMGEEKEVKLHGMWASFYSKRVELALKFKGIPYEYVEEDLREKSQLLLQYNPVHKKVPVLVHKGKPMAESLVILEYIEDYWKEVPLVPQDPYNRAMIRFWVNVFDQKIVRGGYPILLTQGEEQAKRVEEFQESLGLFEQGIAKEFVGRGPFFNGQRPGILDIVMGSSLCSFAVVEEVCGVKLLELAKNPILCAWLTEFSDLRVVKETLPEHDRLVERVGRMREMLLRSHDA